MELEFKGWSAHARVWTRTLCHYLEKDVFCGVEPKDLPGGGQAKRRKKRCVPHSDKAPTECPIEIRPCEAENRSESGQWETDCNVYLKGERTCI